MRFNVYILNVTVMIIFSLLVACTSSDKEDHAQQNQQITGELVKYTTEKRKESTQEIEPGKFSILYEDDIVKQAKSGTMNMNISHLKIGELKAKDDYLDLFNGEDTVTAIMFHVFAKNTSNKTISFYPDHAMITTNTNDQVTAETYFSDDVGGDFIGQVKKEGNIIFFLRTPPEEINTLTLVINGPYNQDFVSVGEDVKMTFEINR